MQANELFTQPNTILLDGGMGTMLQAAGLKLGARPEELIITDPQLIESIHSRYAAAGSRIINANTFGASAHKLAGSEYTLEEIIAAGIANCKRACGYDGEIKIVEDDGKLVWECPKCGNRDQNKLNVARRTCGYIGTQFWNQGRTQEIKDRVLHL